jgi:hypothetical protein
MEQQTAREYARYRALGYTATDALRSARINTLFEAAEDSGAVKFEVVYDQEQYDDSYLDTWSDIHKTKREHLRKQLWNRIEREGTYGIKAYALDPYTYLLVEVDSVWGFIGNDWKDSGYDVDVKNSALQAVQACIQE